MAFLMANSSFDCADTQEEKNKLIVIKRADLFIVIV